MKEKIKALIKHPLFSGSAIIMVGSMTANVVNYIYHLFMGRMLGPVNYGVLASLFSFFYIIGIVPMSGSVAIVKFTSLAKNFSELQYTYFGIKKIIFRIAIILSILIAFSSPIIAKFLHIDNFWLVFLLSPVLFLNLITLVNQATSQGRLKFLGYVVPIIISSVSKFIFGILLVYLGFSVFGAMTGIVIAVALTFITSNLYVKDIKSLKKHIAYKSDNFIKYALPVLFQSLAFTSFFTTDIILVKHYFSPLNAGLYAALSTLGKIIYFAVSPITTAMFPIISKRKSLGVKYTNIFFLSLFSSIFISLIIVVIYYLFPNFVIGALYGKDYLIVQKELVWMGLFMFFYTISYVMVNYFLSINFTKIVLVPLFGSILQIVLIVIMHGSILQVIKNSLFVVLAMFLSLIIFLLYNHLIRDEKT